MSLGMKFFHKSAFDNIINELTIYLSPEFCKCCAGQYNRQPRAKLSEQLIEKFLAKIKIKANKWATDKIEDFEFSLNDNTKEELITELAGKLYFDAKCTIWKMFFDEGFQDN